VDGQLIDTPAPFQYDSTGNADRTALVHDPSTGDS
jgi:hypothetical protein